MGLNGPEFYDDDVVFDTYMSRRETRVDSPNDTLEKPVFDELVGDLTHLRILDLGCGNAAFGLEALGQGCRSYLGIDASYRMVEAAKKKLADTQGKVLRASIESWDYPTRHFDLVTSRLALHYIQNIEPVFVRLNQALIEGGRFIFSIEHPVITSCDRARQSDGPRQDWIVDDYFETGPRLTHWMGDEVIKYHRTIEDYFVALRAAGFVVDALRESKPQRMMFRDEATYERRKRIPLMLFFSAHRPPSKLGL
jgi:Predicted methyltransferase (contains TPR repeat)